MDILEMARAHAGTEIDPERAAKIAARKAEIHSMAQKAFEQIMPLSGQQGTYAGKRVRLSVSLVVNDVLITMTERTIVQPGERRYGDGSPIQIDPGEVWYKDSRTVVGAWRASVARKGYVLHRPMGIDQPVGTLGDLVKLVAAEVGPILIEGE